MSTPGIRFLEKHGVPHRVMKYRHVEKGAVHAAAAIGFPLEQTIKTLVVDLSPGGPVFVLMPGHLQADLKQLARDLNTKKAAMVDTKTAERLTGYLVGGISPFGSRRSLPVYMDESLTAYPEVAINAGRRGTMVLVAPEDILRVTKGSVARLGR